MTILFALALAAVQGAPASKPNVLFIVIDDLGFDDVGFRSHEINTPVIDSLAASGVVLDQYYVQDVCSPSRSVFMTGRYSMHNTIVDWIPPASAYGLPLNETTLAQKMAEAGYACHATGKWHMGFYKWGMTPTFRGFESFVGFYSGGEDYFKHSSGAAYDFRRDPTPNCGKGCSQVDWQDQGVYSTTVFAREAVRIVQNHDFTAKPLFLYLAFQGVHSPAQVPQSYVDPYAATIADPKRRTFAGMLSAVDEGIGNTTTALKAKGVFGNTLVVFTADNGGPTTTGDGVGARNWPLRGGKHSIWEGGTRATGFLTGTALLTAARASHKAAPVYAGLMHGADWFATISAVAGFGLNGTLPLDSIDQWAAILGEPAAANPRTKIVIGNSTNMCSWSVSDPRHHANADPARDGGDLPGGFYLGASGSALACGFAIKEYDGAHHWKLIKGYGGGPDTWCNSSKSGAVCGTPSRSTAAYTHTHSADPIPGEQTATDATCTLSNGTCEPGNNDGDFPTATSDPVAECCNACTAKPNCAGFTLNSGTTPPVCWLKTSLDSNHSFSGKSCVSGSTGKGPFPPAPPAPPGPPGPHPPRPPAPPEPVSTCPNGWCLYDTATDPHEENEVSAANPDIVRMMQKELGQVLESYHEYAEDKSCPPQAYGTDPHVGKVWEPWC